MAKKFYIGIDLGGTSAKAGLFSPEGKLTFKGSIPTRKEDGFLGTIEKLYSLVTSICNSADIPLKKIEAIGIGSPGVVDNSNGNILNWSNFDWKNVPLKSALENRTGCKVFVINDANSAAYGEAKCGAAKAYKDSIFITLGTGVGGGIIIDGKLFEGHRGAGAEIGHMSINTEGITCTCGRKGCFEAYASATALIRDTKRAMNANKKSLLWSKVATIEDVDGRTAFDASKEGDEVAQLVVSDYIRYLGNGIINLVNVLRPEAIILGGGVCNEGDYLLKPLKEYIYKNIYVSQDTIPLQIAVAELKNDAGIYGAAAFARDNCEN